MKTFPNRAGGGVTRSPRSWLFAPGHNEKLLRLVFDAGLRNEAETAQRLGLFGKSAIHPRQLPIIHEAFAATLEELAWAKRVLAAFEQSGGAATRTADGEFVDLPVAERARRLMQG